MSEDLATMHCQQIADDTWMWSGNVNDTPLSLITHDPDLVPQIRPILTPEEIGAELVDEQGRQIDFRVRRR